MTETATRVRVVTLLSPDLQRRWRSLADDDHLHVVAAADARHATSLISSQPAVLLVDAQAMQAERFDIAEVHARHAVPIVVATPSRQLEESTAYVSAGASGCVVTSQTPDEVGQALRAAAGGALVVPRDAVTDLIMVLIGRSPPPGHAPPRTE